MKASNLLLVLLLLAGVSCSLLDPDFHLGGSRNDEMRNDSGENPHDAVRDTAIYLSAVHVPSGYDWRRDTAMGTSACTLMFYRMRGSRCEKLLELPGGQLSHVSPDPDRHHIIDGHLWTEWSGLKQTVVMKDGKTVLDYLESEILLGILELNGVLYSLGKPRYRDGFTLRRNGEVILRKGDGVPFGGFGKVSYDPNGALYEDGGVCCFTYLSTLDGKKNLWQVRDGRESLALSSYSMDILDAKTLGGKLCVAYNEAGSSLMQYDGRTMDLGLGGFITWLDGGVLIYEGNPSIAGNYSIYCYASLFGGVGWNGSYVEAGSELDQIYVKGHSVVGLNPGKNDYEGWYFFSRGCAATLGNDIYMVLTPLLDGGGNPVLRRNGEVLREFDFEGYLSAVAVEEEEYAD